MYNYSGSVEGRLSESVAEGMFLFNAGGSIKTATKIVSGLEKVQSKAQPILEGIKSVTEKGLETGYLSVRNLTNAIENTGTKKFALGAAGGAIGETVVESRDYISGKKEISFLNTIESLNNVSKSGLTGGLTANTNQVQSLGINVASDLIFKNKDPYQSVFDNSISHSVSSYMKYKVDIPEPLSGLSNSLLTEEIKIFLDKNNKEK